MNLVPSLLRSSGVGIARLLGSWLLLVSACNGDTRPMDAAPTGSGSGGTGAAAGGASGVVATAGRDGNAGGMVGVGTAGRAGGQAGQPGQAGAFAGAGAGDGAGAGARSSAGAGAGNGGSSGGGDSAGTGGEAGGGGATTDPACMGGSQVDLGLVGWATQAGGTRGGKGGASITVSNGAALMQALADKQDSAAPLTILVSGTITEANTGADKIDVKDVSDVSILGTGAGAELDGIGIKIVRASNIVVRNLRIHHVASGDKDAISIEGPADHIWIDHCELYSQYEGVDKDFYDGLLDVKGDAEYITYSWNYLHDSWKTGLVGSSETDDFDRKLTMHHNYFRNCNSRMPLFRGGNGHIFNNYYLDVADTGINSRLGACLQIENNHFSNARNPWVSAYSDELGGGELICNVLADNSVFEFASDVRELPSCSAMVPYDYASVLNHPDHVPAVVMENAGAGKLDDPAQF